MTKDAIRRQLDRMIERQVIRSYMIQSGMPGLRWTLEGYGSFSTRSYTTSQVEDWLCGAHAGIEAVTKRLAAIA